MLKQVPHSVQSGLFIKLRLVLRSQSYIVSDAEPALTFQ